MLVVMLLIGTLWSVGALADQSEPLKEDYYELHQLLVDTLDQVERNYVKPVTRRELIEAAIRGVLSELDPYSAYIAPDDMDQFRTTVQSRFGGIGIQITTEHGPLEVVSPLAGTPAYRAGILAGDRIVEIDGKSTRGIELDEAVRQLKGKPGSQVTLTVLHRGGSEPEQVTVTREIIHVDTVLGDHRKGDDAWDFMLDRDRQLGYVRITTFSRDTSRELRKALDQLKKENLRGLILDLRFNPGGLLSSAIQVSDMFVSKGRIVSTKGREPDNVGKSWDAREQGTFEGFPMVALVNRYSASGSEIVAACLQDSKRAVVMGERTWGKGSVQNVIRLEEGRSALKLTTANYYRPSGKNIHRFPDAKEEDEWGVKPDQGYELKLTDKEMMALIVDRRLRDVLRPNGSGQAAPADSDQPEPKQEPETPKVEPEPKQEPEAPKVEPEPKQEPETPKVEPGPKQEPETPKVEPPDDAEPAKFVDRQLQMAIDFLTGELARAD
jgi:carboxyl-terminal processing protease